MSDSWTAGDSAETTKTITEADLLLFSSATGDSSPLCYDTNFARTMPYGRRVVPAYLTASVVLPVIGTTLPGSEYVITATALRFVRPVFVGDAVSATATVLAFNRYSGLLDLEVVYRNQRREKVLEGSFQLVELSRVDQLARKLATPEW
jgi:3-hydroxybutyryl-CoA dehydratase